MAEHIHAAINADIDARYVNLVEYLSIPVDDLPGLAADIHRTVLRLVVHGTPCADVDAAIIDCLRGTAPRAADTVTGHG